MTRIGFGPHLSPDPFWRLSPATQI